MRREPDHVATLRDLGDVRKDGRAEWFTQDYATTAPAPDVPSRAPPQPTSRLGSIVPRERRYLVHQATRFAWGRGPDGLAW